MPDTPELRRAFGQAGGQQAGCGFPVAHLLVLFNAATGLLIDAFASPLRTGDVAQANDYLAHLDGGEEGGEEGGDILIGDDSFSGYAHIALLLQRKLHAVVPNHHLRIVDFAPGRPHTKLSGKNVVAGRPRARWIRSLGKSLGKDEGQPSSGRVQNAPPMSRPQQRACARSRREAAAAYARRRQAITTGVTTLSGSAAFPGRRAGRAAPRRWDVETNLRHLKITLGLDVLHCKSEIGVRKELAVFCLVYNLVRVVMLEAAERQHVRVSRISFADALRWMRHARPGDHLPDLVVNPSRANRIEPRCRKRRPKQYDLMNKPRHVMRNALKTRGRNV